MPVERTPGEIASMINAGETLMIGGFMAAGTPELIVDALVEQQVGDLTVIANDTGFPNVGIGKLVRAGLIRKLYASHVGTNPETGTGVQEKKIELTLIPQGTLIEQIRAGGAGLGGILTPTGIGTVVTEGKTEMRINETTYLLELPITADFALIKAQCADRAGNLIYHGSARNFNPIMATAAKVVVAEVGEWIDGYLDPDQVHTPGILVDYIVRGG